MSANEANIGAYFLVCSSFVSSGWSGCLGNVRKVRFFEMNESDLVISRVRYPSMAALRTANWGVGAAKSAIVGGVCARGVVMRVLTGGKGF